MISKNDQFNIQISQTTNINFVGIRSSMYSNSWCSGRADTFRVIATWSSGGVYPTFQWNKNGINVNGTGVNFETYIDSSLTTGDILVCTLTTSQPCALPFTSSPLVVTILPSAVPNIAVISRPAIGVCVGTPITFTANATDTGSAATYQWRKNGIAIPGAVSSSYTDSHLTSTDVIVLQRYWQSNVQRARQQPTCSIYHLSNT